MSFGQELMRKLTVNKSALSRMTGGLNYTYFLVYLGASRVTCMGMCNKERGSSTNTTLSPNKDDEGQSRWPSN